MLAAALTDTSTIPVWAAIITAVFTVSVAIFGICAFILRSKDLQAMKPTFDQIPLMARDISEQGKDLAEIKGVMSVIPALTTHVEHNTTDINDLKSRVLDLERERRRINA